MKFEIDVSGLKLGDTVSQSVCESLVGIERASDQYRYSFLLMQLADYINRLLLKDSKCWTVVTSEGEIQVLTNEQASQYNARHFKAAMAKMRRCNRRMAAVDLADLDAETRKIHCELLSKQVRILMGMKQRAGNVELTAVEKRTPVRIVGKK